MKVEWVRVGDVLEMRRDPIEIRDDESYRKIGIYSWGRGMIHYPPTPAVEMGSLRYFRFPAQALMLSNIQAWEQAVAVTTEQESAGFVSSNRLLPYVPIDRSVHVPYLVHYLLSESGYELLKRASPGTQVRNRTLGKKLFEDERVPLPSLPDQVRVAVHLDRLTGAAPSIAGQRASSVLEAIIGSLEWSSAMGDLVRSDSDVFEVEPDASYRLMGVYGGGRGAIHRGAMGGSATTYSRMQRVRTGQVVFSRLKAFEGAIAVVPQALHGAVLSKEFPTFSVEDGVDPEYVAALTRSPQLHGRMAARSTGIGARRERLSSESFLMLDVPKPSPEIQRQIGRVHRTRERIELLATRSAALSRALLPAARNEIFNAMSPAD